MTTGSLEQIFFYYRLAEGIQSSPIKEYCVLIKYEIQSKTLSLEMIRAVRNHCPLGPNNVNIVTIFHLLYVLNLPSQLSKMNKYSE